LDQAEQDRVAEVITHHLDAFAWSALDMPGIDPDLIVRVQTATRAPFVSLFQVIPSEEAIVGAKGSWKRSQQKRTKTLGQPAGTGSKESI